jgi:hypothetical protein
MVNVRKEIGVDWLTVTGPEECASDVVEALAALSDRSLWVDLGQGGGYSHRAKLPTGVRLSLGRTDGSGRFMLDVNGAACATLGAVAVHDLARVAGMGGTFTRLDLRCDFRGDSVSLLDDVVRSCDADHFRSVKQWQRFPIKGEGGIVVGDGVILGSYGSTRFVRVYDKGLQTETDVAGRWIRWEAQLRSIFAHQAALDVFCADLDDLPTTAAPHMYHVVDFRIGDRGRNQNRLDRPAWWLSLLDGVSDACVSREPRLVEFERWAEALRDQFGRAMVAASRRSGISVGQLSEWLLDGLEPTAGTLKNPVVSLASAAFDASRRPR